VVRTAATVKVVTDVCDRNHDGRISYAELEALGTVLRQTDQLKKELGVSMEEAAQPEVELSIQNMAGKRMSRLLALDITTVGELKGMIHEAEGWPTDQLRLICKDTAARKAWNLDWPPKASVLASTLGSCGVHDGCTVVWLEHSFPGGYT
jgi:hypothetical protein